MASIGRSEETRAKIEAHLPTIAALPQAGARNTLIEQAREVCGFGDGAIARDDVERHLFHLGLVPIAHWSFARRAVKS